MNQAAAIPLKVLAVGRALPLRQLDSYRVEERPETDSAALAGAIRDSRPDILLLDAAMADDGLVRFLAEPLHRDMPVVLRVAGSEAEQAGLLLGSPVEFVDAEADAGAVRDAVDRAAASLSQHAADSSSLFEQDHRIQSLKRDAERVAAALAELVSARPAEAARPVDAQRIRARIKARRLRERFFPPAMFADPAWDMLLDLSAARLEGQSVSVSSLCIAANVPTTTALRWIKNLCDEGLFERKADPTDARRAFIELSMETAQRMDACLDAVLNHPGQ